MLYLVSTPIGNLDDITLRALHILHKVDLIAAEDTRTSGKLLKHHQINTPLISFHEHSDNHKVEQLTERLSTQSIALITDAGTPSISDPGYRLVQAAIAAGHTITPIPGANAATTALVASGLPTDNFLFIGFLPKQQQARHAALEEVMLLPYTLIIYESPHRLLKLLQAIEKVASNRLLSVARELTKLHEEFFRGTAREAFDHFTQKGIRGEITVVIEGKKDVTDVWEEDKVKAMLDEQLSKGQSRKEAAAEVATQSGWRKRDIYRLGL